MKNKIKFILIFLVILLIASVLYFYKLGSIPNGFYVDEATVAYNAYSIEKTGRDIFDQQYPVLFRLLGSYTPPLFIYVSAVFIHYLGTDPYVFRMISGISALISIIFFYLTIKKLNICKKSYTALIITFFYAISPWLVFNARLGYEVTLGYAIFNIGFYFMLSAIEKPVNLILGLSILSLSTYASHTQRYLVPIFLVFYFLTQRREIVNFKNLKLLIISFLVALIIQVPNLTVINTRAFWVKNARLTEQSTKNIITNIVNQTFSYLSPKSLFYYLPDIDMQHTVPATSVMPNFLVIPYLIGIFLMFKRIREKKILLLVITFFVTLIPAILSGEFISIQRALPFLLPLGIVIGLGIDQIIINMDKRLFFVTFIIFSLYSLLMLYRSYFVLFPKERANAWNYGYSEVADLIKKYPDTNFIVDNSRNPRNYILLLYYLKYPPELYQKEVNSIYKNNYYNSLPPENEYKFSNIEVRPISWEKDIFKDYIIVGDNLTISEGQAKEHFFEKIEEIKDPMQNPIFISYKTNPKEKCKTSFNLKECRN